MSAAVRYAHLVGKYVCMERPADEVEYLEAHGLGTDHEPGEYMVGCEGVVAAVWDSSTRVGGPSVEIMMDYGMGYAIHLSEEDQWRIAVVDSQETMDDIRRSMKVPS